ncbi:Flagellar biosynthesis/type III secretory pathway protein FliH [Duganella sp. CF458]|uniref:HrpE/YscL family type III secretion apparatus protein n=1 Tax=Duganella sp. CF458 TaxID=1884368 RepID=UPI0008E51811|nr:HrpE/YscL family type III secretion apparatus protein [Duganella sp. CF458]SFF95763.1 Flagellar biosynthesis/type III secretory pathway protein FliH [Duganella sp. CF458]
MTGFCKARLDADPRLQPLHGILRGDAIERTADAHVLAGQIVEQGRQEAQQLLAAAREEARLAVHEAQARVLEQAMRLQQGMDAAMAELLEQAQHVVAELAGVLYDRLVLETTAQEKVAAGCRRLLREAPPKLVNAVLRLHPQDMPPPPGLPWPCEGDDRLEPGTCKLEADSGEWRADFSAAAAALRQALASLPGMQAAT